MIKILLLISFFLIVAAISLPLLYILLGLALVLASYCSLWYFGFRIANNFRNTVAIAATKALVVAITFSPGLIAGKDGVLPAPAVLALVLHWSERLDALFWLSVKSLIGVWCIATIFLWLIRKYIP